MTPEHVSLVRHTALFINSQCIIILDKLLALPRLWAVTALPLLVTKLVIKPDISHSVDADKA